MMPSPELLLGRGQTPDVFRVTAVETATPPDGEKGPWCSYTIRSKRSEITGLRRGSRQEVLCHAEAFADDLNARTTVRRQSTWAKRQG